MYTMRKAVLLQKPMMVRRFRMTYNLWYIRPAPHHQPITHRRVARRLGLKNCVVLLI